MATDVIQLLNEESPYGYAGDMNAAVAKVTAQFDDLRHGKSLKDLSLLDGPSSMAKPGSAPKMATTYEEFMEGLFWTFKGKAVRISKAMQLDYEVNGKPYKILIGFEGAGDGM